MCWSSQLINRGADIVGLFTDAKQVSLFYNCVERAGVRFEEFLTRYVAGKETIPVDSCPQLAGYEGGGAGYDGTTTSRLRHAQCTGDGCFVTERLDGLSYSASVSPKLAAMGARPTPQGLASKPALHG